MYGPQFLIQEFGLFLIQASRYGNIEEYLVEEKVTPAARCFIRIKKEF